jgi:signal transduction histidine kinase
MNLLQTFFEINREVVFFVYGLTFFLMGFSTALQSRHYSRLELARSLVWLAGFGITHAFHEWGDVFIPLQAPILSEPAFQLLETLQLLLLAVSFGCLMEFGIVLIRPLGSARWLHGLAAGLLLGWFFLTFWVLLPLASDLTGWHHLSNAFARYLIGFPGGLLTAYGLHIQTQQQIKSLNVPSIVRNLRIAEITFILYAVFGGLIPPPIPFFPGNWINSVTFEQNLIVPIVVFRSLIGLRMAVAIIRALEVFDVETERIIEKMEQQQILGAERQRLARELHDGAIQKVYTAGLLIEANRRSFPHEPRSRQLSEVQTILDDAIADLRRNLGLLQPVTSSLSFEERLHQLADDPRFRSLVNISLEFNLPETEMIRLREADQMLAIVQEALSNVIRHAQAREVCVTARIQNHHLEISVLDDGVGFDSSQAPGFGLQNMQERARYLGGELFISSPNKKGTQVTLRLPWSMDEQN